MRDILLCLAVVIAAAALSLPTPTLQVQVTHVPALRGWDVGFDFAFVAAALDSETQRESSSVDGRELLAPLRAALREESRAVAPASQCDEPWLVIAVFLNTADGSCPDVCQRKSLRFAKVEIELVRACDAGLEARPDIACRMSGVAREGEGEECTPEV